MISVPCLWGWISHATCHVSQHCQSCATRKCPQTIYFREGSWISAKRCAIKHNESRGADPAPDTALTSNSFCHPTFVSFMVSGGNIEVETWIVEEKWEWGLSNGVAQRLRDDDRSNNCDHHQVCLFTVGNFGGRGWKVGFDEAAVPTKVKLLELSSCLVRPTVICLPARPMIPTWHRYCKSFKIIISSRGHEVCQWFNTLTLAVRSKILNPVGSSDSECIKWHGLVWLQYKYNT